MEYDDETSPLKLMDMAEDERPREKLMQKGRTALSDEELIAKARAEEQPELPLF